MAEVFISYKSEDRARVKPLVAALEADGLTVWWDAQLSAGEDWRAAIERNLESAPCVIVVWSAGSIGPDGRFVRDEATRAHRRHAYLPVRIDPVEPPLGFGEIQAQPLEGWKGARRDARYQAVLAAARSILERSPEETAQSAAASAAAAPLAARPGLDRRLVLAGGGAAAIAAIGAGGFFLWPRKAQAQTLAVLPFANLSPDPAQAYFADGLAEELRSSLTLLPQLRVIGRASSEAVRNDDTKAAASKLGVSSIVTGSVRRSGDTLRVTAQLLNGADGVERWSQTFDRPAGDVLDVQSAIAMNVAESLQVRLAPSDLNVGGTRNGAANDLLLRAQEGFVQDSSLGNLRNMLALCDQALALDPGYAKAWALKSVLQTIIAGQSPSLEESQAGLREALASARKAAALAPALPDAQLAIGSGLGSALDMAGSEAAYRQALKLAPNDPLALRIAASGLALAGHAEEALAQIDRAIQLDPLSLTGQAVKARILQLLRRYEDAVAQGRQVLERAPRRLEVRVAVVDSLILLGREPEALAQLALLDAGTFQRMTGEAIIQARRQERPASDETLGRMQAAYGNAAHYQYAQIRAQQKEPGLALTELDAAWTARDPGLQNLITDPFLDPVRAEPRFKALAAKLGFKAA